MSRYRRLLSLPISLAMVVAIALPSAAADPDRTTLERYARDTWASFAAMANEETGMPTDNIGGDLDPDSRAEYTSPTNIAMYIWATLAARDMGIIRTPEARDRIAQTLDSVEQLERHEPSGQFWNWYDPETLETITVWPTDGNTVHPFASSVDNGWLASALHMVANGGVPQLRGQAGALLDRMNFGCYYDPNANQIRGGFWLTPQGGSIAGDYCEMDEQVQYTGHHYGAFNTEPRIASYIGIAMGDIPARHYFGGWRTFPDTCDWSWPETKPIGEWVTYTVDGEEMPVFEGAYPYDDQLVVPTWGGSMFEALMVPLVVPEEEWGHDSWAVTHPLFVESQIEHGLEEADYGYWGFSPSSDPMILNGYREYGVDAIGMEPNGYTSDVERTLYDAGFDGCRPPAEGQTDPEYGQGVVTPHAAFLALDFDRSATMANLAALESDFDGLYGPGGFKDAVNVATGQVADRYLSLDQGMVIAAIANELRHDKLQRYFSRGAVERSLAPLMEMETFGAGRIGP